MPADTHSAGDWLRELLRVLYWQLPATLSWLVLQLLYLLRPVMLKAGVVIKDVFNSDIFNGKYETFDKKKKLPRSVVGHMDKRVDLMDGTKADFPNSSALAKSNADVCAMAMELAYEEPELVEDVVENVWNQPVNTPVQADGKAPKLGSFHFHKYYTSARSAPTCTSDTNAYIFTRDKHGSSGEKSAVVLAFRGTEPFSAVDWATDFEYFWVDLKGIGLVHLGFLRALGLEPRHVNELNSYLETATAVDPPAPGKEREHVDMPRRIGSGKSVGPLYFQLRNELLSILQQNKEAKLFITGHSLGGALAALFTALFIAEVPTAHKRLKALYTFGQPRVGDLTFSWFLHNRISSSELRFIRILHSNDIVPHVPFDDELFQFKHVGPWFHSSPCNHMQMSCTGDQPNLQFFGAYIKAVVQLCLCFFRLLFEREDFKEAPLSIVSRFFALFVPWLVDHSPVNYVNAVRLGLPEIDAKRSWILDLFGKPAVA